MVGFQRPGGCGSGSSDSQMTPQHNTSFVDNFDPTRKKKKKNKKKPLDCNEASPDNFSGKHDTSRLFEETALTRNGHLPQRNFEGDYEYKELLSRVFDMLRANNLEISEEKQRRVMMPPQFIEGTDTTFCINFIDLCRTMHRKPHHVMSFLLAEMGIRGSLDGQQQLILKARISPKDFEDIFRRYIDLYVICGCCKSPDTTLAEENHTLRLICEMCGSGHQTVGHEGWSSP